MVAVVALAGALAGGAVALAARAQSAPELKTEEQKTLYAIGLAVAGSLASFALSPADLELVKAGLTDGVLNRQRQVDLQAYGTKIQELQQRAGVRGGGGRAEGGPGDPGQGGRPRRAPRRRRRAS